MNPAFALTAMAGFFMRGRMASMYTPSSFKISDTAEIHDHMRRYSFAVLVTNGSGGMVATQLPILLDADASPHGRLIGHMARANQQWRDVQGEALVIFPGPHTYVSPTWYQDPGTVPTWNYVTVHAYGAFQPVEDRGAVHGILKRLVTVYEGSMLQPWSYDPDDPVFDKMLREIVGFEIAINRLEGKRKLNQNHPVERRERVVRALQARPDGDSQVIAKMMADMIGREAAGE
jgi:transcriptional regulator